MTAATRLAERLRAAGFVAADDEAAELLAAAPTPSHLEDLVARRLAGEPLAWIVGHASFLGRRIAVAPGVYVPRWQTEAIATHALTHLPNGGVAVDVCTGAGPVASSLALERPGATVVGTDADPAAIACARSNGVDARIGDLFGPVPAGFAGRVDVVVGVPPYVPERREQFLPHDVVAHEPRSALFGGTDGLDVVRRLLAEAPQWLRPGGAVVVECGADQVHATARLGRAAGLRSHEILTDADGDSCGICLRAR